MILGLINLTMTLVRLLMLLERRTGSMMVMERRKQTDGMRRWTVDDGRKENKTKRTDGWYLR